MAARKKWTPSKEQLDAYKKQIEKTQELSKTAIRDIFDNYSTDMDTIIDYITFASKFYKYSPNNVAMIKAQLPDSTFVQSGGAWFKMGAVPKKGTHGAKILVPQNKKFIIAEKDIVLEKQELGDEQREKIISSNAKYVAIGFSEACKEIKSMAKKGKFDIKEKLVYGQGTVFDIAQTTYPKEDYPKLFTVGIPDEKANFMCNAITNYINERTPYSIEDIELESISLHGFYSPSSNSICINNNLEDSEKIYVILHELGHAFYHNVYAHEIEQENTDDTRVLTTERKEIEADIFSIMNLSMYGFELNDSLKEHLKGNYKQYIAELEELGKTPNEISKEIEILSTKVMKKFNTHVTEMNLYIEEYTLQQEQETFLEEDEINQETDENEMSL